MYDSIHNLLDHRICALQCPPTVLALLSLRLPASQPALTHKETHAFSLQPVHTRQKNRVIASGIERGALFFSLPLFFNQHESETRESSGSGRRKQQQLGIEQRGKLLVQFAARLAETSGAHQSLSVDANVDLVAQLLARPTLGAIQAL